MKKRLAWPAAVAALTAAVFATAVKNGFVNWDDRVILMQNPYFRGLGWANVSWMFSNFTTGKYQPLSWLTFGLDYLVWGMNPAGYHLTALLWHAATAVVFYFVGLELLSAAGFGRGEADRSLAAGLGALFFALHPLRVESVAWATERGDPVSGFFYLLTILLYLQERLGAACLAFALSLAAKATGVTLPAVLLLLDIYPLRRRGFRKLLAQKAPFLIVAFVFALIGLKGQSTTRALVPMVRFGMLERVEQSLFGPVFYLAKTIWPAELSPLYVLSPRLQPAPFLLSALLVLLLTAALWSRRRRWPWALAVWVYFLLALLPVIGLVKLGLAIASDRYTYLASLGPALIFGAAAASLAPRRRVLATAVLAALALVTVRQIGYWHDSVAFWSRAVEVDADCYVCHKNLGDALAAQGQQEEAKRHLWLSTVLLAKARHDLGEWYFNAGRYEEARLRFAEALETLPEVPETENNLGLTFYRLGRLPEALEQFEKALKIKPDFMEAAHNRDVVREALKRENAPK